MSRKEKNMTNPIVDFLCQRVSSPRLTDPAPAWPVLESVFQSAFRAPDHKMLRPWRYMVIEGESRERLGDVFVRAAQQSDAELSSSKIDKLRAMPLRAPMLVVAIASPLEHPKVPELEQIISCSVGVGYMLVALQALGFGGVWRTGELAYAPYVAKELGLAKQESIVGFLYVGTPLGEPRIPPVLTTQDYVQFWQG